MHEGILQRLGQRVYGSYRNFCLQQSEPVLRGVGAKNLIQNLGQQSPVFGPIRHGGKPGVVCQLRVFDILKQQFPELLGHAHQENPAILCTV